MEFRHDHFATGCLQMTTNTTTNRIETTRAPPHPTHHSHTIRTKRAERAEI
ncbi:hypothetical protein [Methanocalculus taiwanensis]|uniref:hypothetical protein n=1 Tax=Methanocalculus taiwanensis TaxID=106207 RepID=UPI0021018A19|nr:hypothetical protein [Methanocalculus taiwanensis]